jgi:hypothetical protein
MRVRADPWLWGPVVCSAALGLYQLHWGLPNGNASWAADALGPLTVLSIARRSAVWNSGWFFFKYPLGYPLVLSVSYAPYLGYLIVSGGWRNPTTTYPFGFADIDAALYTLALIGRLTSVVFVVATVALTYDIGRRLLGRTAGGLGAWFLATAYPLVYYAHTTNLDAAYLFFLTLSLWATLLAADAAMPRVYVVLGVAAAMAVCVKEQGFAFLLPLPVLIAVYRYGSVSGGSGWARWRAVVWNRATRLGLVAMLLTTAVATNAFVNPQGLANRYMNLTGHELPGVTARLTPIEFAVFKGVSKEWQYLRQLADAMESTFGPGLLFVALAGVVYLVWLRNRATVFLLVPAAAYYLLSLRAHDLITLRYTLPLMVIAALCAGAMCASLVRRGSRPAFLVVAALALFALARGVELDLLLRSDSRYAAEAWLRENVAAGNVVETYQKQAYLPRLQRGQERNVPLEERSIDGVLHRRPDFIVISSAAKRGVTHRWNPDWRKGNTLLLEVPEATAFLQALEAGDLPYEPVARFAQVPTLLRVRITSLCPEIFVFRRVTS